MVSPKSVLRACVALSLLAGADAFAGALEPAEAPARLSGMPGAPGRIDVGDATACGTTPAGATSCRGREYTADHRGVATNGFENP